MQINPSGSNRFKKTDNVAAYTEIYAPLLTSANPPQVMAGYAIVEKGTGKVVYKSGAARMDEFVKKGSPMVPVGMKIKLDEMSPGSYQLVMMAADGAGNHAKNRVIDFDVTP
jgi:hypothetical protein